MSISSLKSIVSESNEGSVTRVRRLSFVTLFPWLLLLGFIGLLALLFGERLLPAREVSVQKVVTVRAEAVGVRASERVLVNEESVDRWSGDTQFQASGWVEPDPLPIKATSLINGVVASVSVLEGEAVSEGDVLATLIQDDFVLDLETAKSQLESLKGMFAAHEAQIASVEAEQATLALRVKAGEKRCLELIDRRDRLIQAGDGAVSEGDRVEAELRLQTHQTEVEALAATGSEIQARLDQLVALRQDFEARIRAAETEVARRQLALDRTEIRSPVDGVILRLLVSPGQKRMLDMDDPDSSTVAIVYQPDFLQARIDVPLEEASGLGVGQAVRLRSNFLPDRVFQGSVTRIVGEADLQRNTLQVKVKIHDPDPRLRPDMLCRAEFLAAHGSGKNTSGNFAETTSGAARVSVYAPLSALLNSDDRVAQLWVLDSSRKRIEKRTVQLGSQKRDGHVLVSEGLLPGEFVIANPASDLSEGERVNYIMEGNDE